MPSDEITRVHDELGDIWIYPDGRVTVFTSDGSVIMSDPNGPDREVHPDGSLSTITQDFVYSRQFPDGTKYTWSDRDEKWVIHFSPQLDGSRWEHNSLTGEFIERGARHPERPQGRWEDTDGTVVIECNHNLFRSRDEEYAIRYSSEVPDRGALAGEWHPVTRDVWAWTLAGNEQLEADHHDPHTAATMATTDAAHDFLAAGMQSYVEVMITVGGMVGGPVGSAMEKTWSALQTQEQLRHAESWQDAVRIVANNYVPDPADLAIQTVVGHALHTHLGKASLPDAPHGSIPPHSSHVSGSNVFNMSKAETPTEHLRGEAAASATAIPPAHTGPGSATTPAPTTTIPASMDGAPTAPAALERGIAADPFASNPLTAVTEHPLPGQRSTEPLPRDVAPDPVGVPVQKFAPGPVVEHGSRMHVGQPPVPAELEFDALSSHPNSIISASTKPELRLAAALGPPPGLKKDWEAHHIVPTKAGGNRLDDLRERLEAAGIRLDDAENGVWLPRYDHRPNPVAALPHQNWVHARPADYTYTIYKRCEGKTGEALRAEIAHIKAELGGYSATVFQIREAPPGWHRDIVYESDAREVPGDRPGPGSDARPESLPISPPQNVPSAHVDGLAVTDRQGVADTGHAQGSSTAVAAETAPASQLVWAPPGGDPAPPIPNAGAQIVAGASAGADTAGDRGAITQDGSKAHATSHVSTHDEVAATEVGFESAHPASEPLPGGVHASSLRSADAAAASVDHNSQTSDRTTTVAAASGVMSDQGHPSGDRAGTDDPLPHVVGLPDDPIAHLAQADPHASVGLPGSSDQDHHANEEPDPDFLNGPDHNPALKPDQHPFHQPMPLPDYHQAQLQYHAPTPHQQPPAEHHETVHAEREVVTQVPGSPGGSGE